MSRSVSDEVRREYMTLEELSEELSEELLERAEHPLDQAAVRTNLIEMHEFLDEIDGVDGRDRGDGL